MDGIDELIKKLDDMGKGVKELEGTNDVSFGELFTNAFMKKHTKHNSIESFFDNSPFKISSDKELEEIDEAELDKYVDNNSKFNSWKDMLGKAVDEYLFRKMGL